MTRFFEKNLKDGSRLELFVLRFPGCSGVPDWVKALFGAPDGSGWGASEPSGRRYLKTDGWERYYHDMFSGASADECTDFLYAALVDGVPAGRMWFGYSNRTRCGNFGNVETFPEFRRRGIMREELQQMAADFGESNALFVSCGAADTAAPAYAEIGFKRILGPENHAMALVKPEAGSFAEILKKAYGNNRNAVIRAGKRGDRFELDKLLAYAPEIEFQRNRERNMFSQLIPDYMHAFQHVVPEHSALSVVESAAGFCAGFAYAEKCLPEITAVIFTVHPAFCRSLVPLLEHVTRQLDKHLWVSSTTVSAECDAALHTAGFKKNEYGFFEKNNFT